jgi:hypothetical protein
MATRFSPPRTSIPSLASLDSLPKGADHRLPRFAPHRSRWRLLRCCTDRPPLTSRWLLRRSATVSTSPKTETRR